MRSWRREDVVEPARKFWNFLAINLEPMAEVIVNFMFKRGNSSSGSEDEVNEPKKKNKESVYEKESQIAEVVEDNDKILKTLEMTNDVISKLKVKLDKLNTIEISVKNMETNLAGLEKGTTKLKEAELSTKRDV